MAKRKRSRQHETGPDSAGQSGNIQQIPGAANADSESVGELLEEGNTFEAEAVEGVEDAKDADVLRGENTAVSGGRCSGRVPRRRQKGYRMTEVGLSCSYLNLRHLRGI